MRTDPCSEGFDMFSALSQLVRDAREAVGEQFEYRELLYQMTKRDLLLRYKQAAMGFAWALFMPLTNTAVFSIIFTRIAPLQIDVPYPLFAFLGLLAWNFTASALRFSVTSLTSNVNLVTKVYFPREIFPFSSILVTVVDTLVGTVLLAALMIYYRYWPGVALVYLPIVMLVHLIFTTAVALLLAMANLFFRDVKYLFEVGITLWMFGTSVLYPSNLVDGAAGAVLRANPMTAIIDGYRDVLLYARSPMSPAFVLASAGTVVFFLVVSLVFHRAEFRFAESV
jgi:ABC-type polysaccharide/polyol phosphate export permease